MAQLNRDPPWNRHIERDSTVLDANRLAALNAKRHEIDLVLQGIIIDGVAAGVFDSTADASVATNSIISLMNATNRWRRPNGRRSFREITDWYKRFILNGLLA